MGPRTDQNSNLNGRLATRAQQSTAPAQGQIKPIDKLKGILSAESVQEQFKNVLAENAGSFVASIIDLWNGDKYLQMCDPKLVVGEALKAASLKLPINKQLGFAYIVAYRDNESGQYIPTFQLGYKGYIQLSLRTGSYRYINADVVYEGEMLQVDKLTGDIKIDPSKRVSDQKIGYFAFVETLNGFRKALYMTVEEVTKHAKRFSKSYNSSKGSTWKSDFDAMAMKTCIRLLLSKYGIMSVEMQKAYIDDSGDSTLNDTPSDDQADDDTFDADFQVIGETGAAQGETAATVDTPAGKVDTVTGQITDEEIKEIARLI